MKTSEFTREDVSLIEKKIIKIESERADLVYQKKDLEVIMMSLKNKVRANRNGLSRLQYKDICKKQEDTRSKILNIEKDIRLKKQEIDVLNNKKEDISDAVVTKNDFSDLINTIQFLKNKYTEFSMDKTRIPAMRKMTEEFSAELQQVINYIKTI